LAFLQSSLQRQFSTQIVKKEKAAFLRAVKDAKNAFIFFLRHLRRSCEETINTRVDIQGDHLSLAQNVAQAIFAKINT
jgi:hypothetical protein